MFKYLNKINLVILTLITLTQTALSADLPLESQGIIKDIPASIVENFVPATKTEHFLDLLFFSISSAILAFILTWIFPKFMKKTAAILKETKKAKLIFNAMKWIFLLLIIFCLSALTLIGIYPALSLFGLLIILSSVGPAIFSFGVLESILNKKKIKFTQLSKFNKLASLLSVNFILMLFILPFALFTPTFKYLIGNEMYELNIAIQVGITIFSIFGIGMLVTSLSNTLSKNSEKL
jgi:hypothetical protein